MSKDIDATAAAMHINDLIAGAKTAMVSCQQATKDGDFLLEATCAGRALAYYAAASAVLRAFPEVQADFDPSTLGNLVAFVQKWQG